MRWILALLVTVSIASYVANANQGNSAPLFENDANGQSKVERISNNVAQINVLMGEVQALKADVEALKAKVAKLEKDL